jgi:hypothetical protein
MLISASSCQQDCNGMQKSVVISAKLCKKSNINGFLEKNKKWPMIDSLFCAFLHYGYGAIGGSLN